MSVDGKSVDGKSVDGKSVNGNVENKHDSRRVVGDSPLGGRSSHTRPSEALTQLAPGGVARGKLTAF